MTIFRYLKENTYIMRRTENIKKNQTKLQDEKYNI